MRETTHLRLPEKLATYNRAPLLRFATEVAILFRREHPMAERGAGRHRLVVYSGTGNWNATVWWTHKGSVTVTVWRGYTDDHAETSPAASASAEAQTPTATTASEEE